MLENNVVEKCLKHSVVELSEKSAKKSFRKERCGVLEKC